MQTSSAGKKHVRAEASGARPVRIALIAGVVASLVLQSMILVHAFWVEPRSDFPIHVKLIVVSLLATLMSFVVAIASWQYVRKAEASRQLEEDERLFRLRADDSPMILWMTDAQGKCVFANKAWQQFTGRGPEAHLGDGWGDPIHADDRAMAFQDYQERSSGREPIHVEYRVKRHDGVYRWILDTGYPRYNEQTGAFEGYTGGCVDVTERRAVTEELAQWTRAMEQSMDGIARLDLQGRYELVSKQYAKFVGRSVEELIGVNWEITVHPDDLSMLTAAYAKMMVEGRVEAEARGMHADGSVFYKRVAMVTRRDEQGVVVGHYCFMKDITAEYEREQCVRAASRKLEALTVSAPVSIYHKLPDGSCTYVNPEWGRMTGYPLENALGMGWLKVVHADDRDRAKQMWDEAVASGRDFESVVRAVRPDGEVRWIVSRATRVVDAKGQSEYIGTLVDFTDVKEEEMSLRESLKTQQQLLTREAALRRELDHRVRNNLAGLLGLLQVYESRKLPTRELVEVMEGKILVLKEVHEMLAGGGGQPIALAEIISRLVTRLAPSGRTTHVRFSGPRVLLANMQAGAMAMIVQELLTNSTKHGALSVQEGQIAVRWSMSETEPDRLLFDWVELPLVATPRMTDGSREEGIGLTIVDGLARAELRGACTYGPRLDGVDKAWVVTLEATIESAGEQAGEHAERSVASGWTREVETGRV